VHWSQVFWPRGRINRAPFWVASMLGNGVFNTLVPAIPDPSVMWFATLIFLPILAYVNICVLIGRLHDVDRSGWWSLPIWLTLAAIFAAMEMNVLQVSGMVSLLVWPSRMGLCGSKARDRRPQPLRTRSAGETHPTVRLSHWAQNHGEHSSVRANDSKRVGGSSRTQNFFSHLRHVRDPTGASPHVCVRCRQSLRP
jgi:uncharacterized membrane protein YhaH (DUF805 family)